jgi:hypothetical protein
MALIQIEPYVIDSTENFTFNNVNATGNLSSLNANLGNLAIANFFSGSGANLTSLPAGNISGQVGNALISGTVYTNAQPNITSLGTLYSVTVTGNGSFGNILGPHANGNSNVNIPSANGNINLTAAGNTTMVITGVGINVAGNISGNYFIGNGSQLTGIDAAGRVVNGTSNLTIATSGGNVTTSVAGTANIMVVTSTGVNVAGYANVTGNINAPYFIGNGAFLTGVDTNPANISNGNSNVNIPTANGNITFNAVGNANIMKITGTGVNVAGYANITGNVNAPYFIGNGAFLTGVDVTPASMSNGNSNVNIPSANGNITFSAVGNANIMIVTGTGTNVAGTLNATGNANAGNIGATGGYFTTVSGSLTTAAQPNITSVGSLTGLTVSNATGIVDFTTSANVTLGAVSNLHISGGTSGYVLQTDGSGTLSWVAQSGGGGGSNIANGNSTVNIPTANGNINFTAVGNTIMVITGTGVNVAGTLNTTGNVALSGANVSLGTVANVRITGGTNGYVLQTDGAGNLSWVPAGGGGGAAYISNGTSIVDIATAGGNVTTSVGGNANIVVVTSTGANINGTANITGNVAFGSNVTLTGSNISGANDISANTFTGTLTTASQPNITSVGTLSSLTVSGLLTGNTANYSGNVAVSNLSAGSGTGGSITGANLISANYFTGVFSNGNSNISIPAANGNVTVGVGGNANVLIVTSTGANVAGNANITGNIIAGAGAGGNIIGANYISANYFYGTIVSGASSQPNITSVGTLTGLTVSNATANISFTANVANFANVTTVEFQNSSNINLGAVANLRIANGTANQFLQTNGSGNVTWAQATPIITDNTSSGSTFYPVYATSTSGGLLTAGITTTKLQFIPSTGQLTVQDLNTLSDATLKENPQSITDPMSILSQLFGMGFNWTDSKKKSYGLMAQMVEKILPELVSTNSQGKKAVNYIPIIAFLIEAVKKQQEDIDALKKR